MKLQDVRFVLFPGTVVFHLRWSSLLIVLCACLSACALNGIVLAAPHASESQTHDHQADADHHNAAHGDAHDGFHQPYSLRSDLPFWSAIAFLGFVLAIKGLGLWDLLLTNMSTREKAEAEAISTAESDLLGARTVLRTSRGRLEALDEQIRETMAEADRDARSTRNDIIAIAEREAQASVDRARLEIDRVRDQTLNEIFETVADRVADKTEQRLRSGLKNEDHDRLIGSMLNDLAIR